MDFKFAKMKSLFLPLLLLSHLHLYRTAQKLLWIQPLDHQINLQQPFFRIWSSYSLNDLSRKTVWLFVCHIRWDKFLVSLTWVSKEALLPFAHCLCQKIVVLYKMYEGSRPKGKIVLQFEKGTIPLTLKKYQF